MVYKTIKNEDGEYEVFYEQNRPENSDYLHQTEKGIENALDTLSLEEEKVAFRLNRTKNKKERLKFKIRLNKINNRFNELMDWKSKKFPFIQRYSDDLYLEDEFKNEFKEKSVPQDFSKTIFIYIILISIFVGILIFFMNIFPFFYPLLTNILTTPFPLSYDLSGTQPITSTIMHLSGSVFIGYISMFIIDFFLKLLSIIIICIILLSIIKFTKFLYER